MEKIKVFFVPSKTKDTTIFPIFILNFLIRNCLDLIDDASLVINERNLIESQNICDFFQYSITPLESKPNIVPNFFVFISYSSSSSKSNANNSCNS
jgi:hypothetical protein